MKITYRLAAGAALGAIALASGAPAEAKARKHAAAHKHAADPRDAKIKALEAKVDALTQRLDAVEFSNNATAQQVQSAQAAATAAQNQAAAAQSQANTALSQAETAQTQTASVQKEVPPLEKALKTGWFANTSIAGKAFFNVSNIHQTSTDLAGNKTDNGANGTETELKRFYVSVDHKFNDMFSADITTDFRYNTNGTTKDVLVYVKKAYLQAKFAPELWVRVGAADLPWVPFDEGVYGYRFVENTLIDRTKFGTSSDWGVHVGGTFGKGIASYQISAINGAGYKTLTRSSDTIDLEGRVNVNPIKEITLAVGGYTGKLSKSAANQPSVPPATPHVAQRFDALAAYTDKRIRAGVEYFAAKNWNTVTSVAHDKSHGWSAFGSFAFTSKIAVFGRYDWVKPSTEINPALKDHYYNVGLDFKPIGPLDLALVYKRDSADTCTVAALPCLLSTSNGTIGGPKRGTYDELGVFGQFVF